MRISRESELTGDAALDAGCPAPGQSLPRVRTRRLPRVMRHVALVGVAAVGAAFGAAPLGAQQSTAKPGSRATPSAPLSLADALREADRHAFANRLANASSAGDAAQVRRTLQGILPTARIEGGIVRTTDPIGAFGTMLRQRQVTAAAFDPAHLNDPAAITNVQSGVVLEVPLLNSDAWIGRRAATAAAVAGRANEDWTARSTRSSVVRAYYGAVLASEQISTVRQALGAAEAAQHQVQSMVQQGLVTKADALQASVRVTQVSSELIAAQNDALTAQQQLGLLLGRRGDDAPDLPVALPDDGQLRSLAVRDTLVATDVRAGVDREAGSLRAELRGDVRVDLHPALRADLRAAEAGVEAAAEDRRRAMSTMLPRVNGFARYDWNTPTALFGGQKNWTVGLMASWSLFNGGGALADVAGATAKATSARVGADAAHAQAQLEGAMTRRAVIVALQRLDLASLAAEQSREAHRLVEKRYAGGLATIAELLSADASATGAAMARSAARFALISAVASHRLAIGADPAELATLGGAP